jgi:hypothetical protein
MNNIKIVRLHNGDDIIGDITHQSNGSFDIYDPMVVEIDYRNKFAGLVMSHWLPFQIIKKNQVNLKTEDILFILEPSDDLTEYYISSVERIKEIMDAKESIEDLDEENYSEIMDAFEEMQNEENILH